MSLSSAVRLLRRARIDVTPLRERDFRLVISSGVITMLGSFITLVAIPYQIKVLTGSYLAVGVVGFVEFVAIVVCGLWGGLLADSMDRRRIIVFAEAGMALLAAGLFVNALSPRPAVWPLYLIAGGMAALDSLQRPSLNALIPRLVSREKIPAAIALQSMRWQVGSIAGPAVGGLLVTQVGIAPAYAVDLASFIISLALLMALRPVPVHDGGSRMRLRGLREGFRYAFARRELVGTYAVDIAAMLLAIPVTLFPFVIDRFQAPWALGLLYAAPAIGALLVSLTSGWVAHVHRHGMAVLLAAGAWGLAIAAFGVAPDPITAVALLIVAGAADMISGLFRQTIWNQTIPDHLRGRLAGIELLSFSIGPTLGQVRAGGMATLIGLRGAIVSGGLACVGAVVLLGAVIPAMRGYDERTTPHRRRPEPPQTAAE
jgi:MFS family permease